MIAGDEILRVHGSPLTLTLYPGVPRIVVWNFSKIKACGKERNRLYRSVSVLMVAPVNRWTPALQARGVISEGRRQFRRYM